MKISKISATILLIFLCNQYLIAQKLPDLIPFKEKDLFGYCDSNLNVVIKAQYQRVNPFIEDRALVIIDNLCGFIDRKGNQIVPCIYRYARPYSKGYAVVGRSIEEAKYIDLNGQFSSKEYHRYPSPPPPVGPRVDRSYNRKMGPVKEGRYFYRNREYVEGYMTVDGDIISSSEYKYPHYCESYSTSDNYDQKFQHFYESRAIVSGTNGQGYIDLNGALVIDTVFDVAFNFKEGRAKVKLNGKYGFIDKEGNVIGEIKYDQACYFYDGMAQVVLNEKCGYINLEGEEIVPIKYDYWQGEKYSSFDNGLVRVRINEKFGIVDRNGKALTDVKYDDIRPFYNKCAIIILNDKFGLIDENGNEVIPPIYSRLRWLDKFALAFELEPDKRRYGLINSDGKVLVSDSKNRPGKEEGLEDGIYKVIITSRDYFFIDKYGTKYLK